MTEKRTLTKPKKTPCALGTCGHTACEVDRATAYCPCSHCGEPIGYDTAFVVSDLAGTEDFAPNILTHADCVLPVGSQFHAQ